MAKQFKPETLCVQAGWTPKKGEPRVLPIYQSTTFKYDTSEQMARLFDLIPACKTRPMTRLPPRLPPLKVV